MPNHGEAPELTALLRAWREGDEAAEEQLLEVVYAQLRRLAGGVMKGERPAHTLQPTALVHDAYLRLVDSDVSFANRAHFFALAARVMRRVLVDHAKARSRQKRGGDAVRVTLDTKQAIAERVDAPIEALESALQELESLDVRKARTVELHFLAGLTYEEIAEVLEVSRPTVQRDLRFAKAWLHQRLQSTFPQ